MIAMCGRLQKEGEVIHIICDRIVDRDDLLRSIGRTDFAVAPGCGDAARNGSGPDPRDPGWTPQGACSRPHIPASGMLRIRSHDFH